MRTILRIAVLLALSACGSTHRAPLGRWAPTPPLPSATASGGAPTSPADAHPDDAEIAKATQAYLDLLVEVHPERATSLGLHQRDSELDDRTIAGHDKATAREAELLDALEKRFIQPRASAAAKTDLALLIGALRCDVRVRRVERPLQRQPDAYVEPLESIFQLVAREYAPPAERAKNALARIEKLPKTVALAKENLLNPPKVWTEIGIEKAAAARSFLADQRAFLVGALPDETTRIDAALKAATAAYEDYARYLRTEGMKRSNGRFSAGKELFEYLLANNDFLEENADQLLAIGKRVFADTNKQMTELAKKMEPQATSWAVVTKKIKAKHPTAPELVASYQKEVKRARDFLGTKDAVAFPPGDALEVIETPSFMRATLQAAYNPPPAFDERMTKGFFFVTPVDKTLSLQKQEEMLRENDWADITNTSVHEAYPGHHLQLSFGRRHPSRARRAGSHSILEEGWALYAEELMAELGYYDDAERLIQLEWTLVRAARVVIDVGLHAGDMTYEQAVKMLTDEVHLERTLAVSEAKRYTANPTQASAYVIGREKIFELRERARQRDGAKFSLKAFHTDLLSRGSIPPSLIAKEMFASP